MGERPKHWIKLWVSWLTSPAHLELSGGALGLGPLLLLLATWDGEYESGGWLLGEDGRPYDRNALARATHRTRGELERQLLELVRVGTLVIDGRGAYGFAHFGHWQETRNAKYNRVKRAKAAHDHAHSDNGVCSEVGNRRETEDGRRQILATQETTPTPPREGPPKPKPKASKSAARQLDLRAAPIVARIEAIRAELELTPLQASQRTDQQILARLAEGVTIETLLAAVEARGAELSAGEDDPQYFTPISMFTGPSGRGPGGWSVSLRALDRAKNGRRRQQPDAAATGGRVGRDVDDVIADRGVAT